MKSYGVKDELGREAIEDRIARYLGTWTEGLSTSRMAAWIHSCTKAGGYTQKEYEQALRNLRDSGRVAIANGVWYVRNKHK